MGQYYHPINITKKEFVYSHDYGNGLKLMEHSYIGNGFVAIVEELIKPGGRWHGDRIVWAGDYADPETELLTENPEQRNLYVLVTENDENKIRPEPKVRDPKFRILANLDKLQYINLDDVPAMNAKWQEGEKWYIHPLPLMTCEGNGRGGGDYQGDHPLIGSWARNRVVLLDEAPMGYTRIDFPLTEE